MRVVARIALAVGVGGRRGDGLQERLRPLLTSGGGAAAGAATAAAGRRGARGDRRRRGRRGRGAAAGAAALGRVVGGESFGGFQSGLIGSLKPMCRWFWCAASVK